MVIAFAAVLNFVVSLGLFCATQNTASVARKVFEAGNRPYIGVLSISPRARPPNFEFTIALKNFGTAPAESTDVRYRAYVNGAVQPVGRIGTQRTVTIFPGLQLFLTGGVLGPSAQQILDGSAVLTVLVQGPYKGPEGKTYTYSEEYRYNPEENNFINLGTPEK